MLLLLHLSHVKQLPEGHEERRFFCSLHQIRDEVTEVSLVFNNASTLLFYLDFILKLQILSLNSLKSKVKRGRFVYAAQGGSKCFM